MLDFKHFTVGVKASIKVDLSQDPTNILSVDAAGSSQQSDAAYSQTQGTENFQAIFANDPTAISQVAQQGDRRLGRATTDEPAILLDFIFLMN